MLIGVTLATIGLQSIYFGCLAHVFLDYGGRRRERWRRIFTYTKSVVVERRGLHASACALVVALVVTFISKDFALPAASSVLDHLGILGLLLMVIGFSTFCFTLLLHATRSATARSPTGRQP